MQSPDQERLARILDDYLVSIEQGLPVTPEELIAKYPEDAEQLRGYLSGLQLFHAAAGPGPASGSLGGQLPQPMQSIGDYQLVREIGRGGMGVVYEAHQQSLRRRVALKILPFTVANDVKQISRFKNEAQAAAQVQHPNIVPVYAVGEENGVHYYVMQLIEGQSLTNLLDGLRTHGHSSHGTTAPNYPDRTLTWPQGRKVQPHTSATPPSVDPPIALMKAAETADHIRVVARLAHQAADALHAAHEYGVVHRDVKPSNLLLDDQGKLWITDFGLARCREQQGLTQTGDILGTMRYMSPEQALGRGALVDQRTDIYSLGITMYELATLHHPADGLSDLQLYFDRQREAPKPLRQWNRHIPADFQTIVLKCVSEFPQERYSTAKELADDLDRFLEGRPITASPPSLVSRATKWAKRRRGLVYATAAVLFVAITGAVTSMAMLAHVRNASRDRALEQTRRFLKESPVFNLTKYTDRLAAIPGAESVAGEILGDGIEYFQKYERDAANDPALAADWALAQSKLGMLNEKLGRKQESLDAHTKALQVWQEQAARDPSNVDNARNLAVAQNNLAKVLLQQEQLPESLALLEGARNSQVALLKADPESKAIAADLAATRGNLGMSLMQAENKTAATTEFEEGIRIGRHLADDTDASENVLHDLAMGYNNLGSLQDIWQPVLAADAYRNAIDIERRLVKANPINRLYQGDLARTYSNLGYLSSRTKDWAKAEVCYGDAIQIQQNLIKLSPTNGPYRRDLAISFNNLGMAQMRINRLAAAESSFHKSAKLQDALLAVQPDNAEILNNQSSVWNNTGILLDQQQRFSDAEKAYKQSIANQRHALDVAPKNERYRSLLGHYYLNSARNLNQQAKFDQSVQAAVERKQLWPRNAERVYSVAQQLTATYAQMQAANSPQKSQAACAQAAVETLRESVAAGLPHDRLQDKSLASLTGAEEYRKLINEPATTAATPSVTRHSSVSHAE